MFQRIIGQISRYKLYIIGGSALVLRLLIGVYFFHKFDTPNLINATRRLVDDANPFDIYLTSNIGYPFAKPPLWAIMVLPFVLLFDGTSWIYLGVKIPVILADFGCAYLIREYFLELDQKKLSFYGWVFWLFNPICIYTSAYEGSAESVMLLFLLLTLKNKENTWKQGLYLALGLLTKIQFIIFILPVLVHKGLNTSLEKRIQIGIMIVGIFTAVCLPFYIYNPERMLYSLFLRHEGRPPGKITWWTFALLLPDTLYTFFDNVMNYAVEFVLITNILIVYLTRKQENSTRVCLLAVLAFLVTSNTVFLRYFTMLIPWMIFYELERREYILHLFTNVVFFMGIILEFFQSTETFIFLGGLFVALLCAIYLFKVVYEMKLEESMLTKSG
ncbi:MAG: hypothetical protein ACFFCD_16005 [Promethearchaeota archaeon]